MEKEEELAELVKLDKDIRKNCSLLQTQLLKAMHSDNEEEVERLAHEIKNYASALMSIIDIRREINND